MLEANRDASVQCLAAARDASKRGQVDRAVLLCEKSLRLFPTDDAQSFLAALQLKRAKQEKTSNEADKLEERQPKPDVRKHVPVHRDYTEEQQRMAIEIKGMKCYYTRLAVEVKCSDIDLIKKAYKKRAFQFHPDKNHAPASAEAFKAISQAYECLIDDNRKAAYDRYGTEDPNTINAANSRGGYASQSYRRGGEDITTAEDILNMFFSSSGQHMPQFQRRRTRAGPSDRPSPQTHWFQILLQFLPVLLILLFSLWSGPRLNSSSSNRDVFSLDKGDEFVIHRTTSGTPGLPYYVSTAFGRWYGHDKRAVARIDYLVMLAHAARAQVQCEVEKSSRDAAILEAKQVVGQHQAAAFARAHAMPLGSCDMLSQIYAQ